MKDINMKQKINITFDDLISEIEKTKLDIQKSHIPEIISYKEKKLQELIKEVDVLKSQMDLMEKQIQQIKNSKRQENTIPLYENNETQKHLMLFKNNLVKPIPPALKVEKETFYGIEISFLYDFQQMDLSQKMKFIVDNKFIEKSLFAYALKQYNNKLHKMGKILFLYSGAFKEEKARIRRVASQLGLKETFKIDEIFTTNEWQLLSAAIPTVFVYNFLKLNDEPIQSNICLLDIINRPNNKLKEYIDKL